MPAHDFLQWKIDIRRDIPHEDDRASLAHRGNRMRNRFVATDCFNHEINSVTAGDVADKFIELHSRRQGGRRAKGFRDSKTCGVNIRNENLRATRGA